MEKDFIMENWCLLVDDNSVNLMIVANMMKHFDINVDKALSGAEAIRMAGEKEYDIIFMDYLMPELNGIETTKEIRKWDKGKKAAIIALTANLTEDVVSEFLSNGANEVTSKPMNKEDLDELMEKWVPYIAKEESDVKKTEDNGGKKSIEWLREKLKEISMDTDHGAFRLSDDTAGNYRILTASVTNIKDALWHLSELKKVTLWQEMRLDFHSMKGIFANLGVKDLSQRCGRMEMLAAEGNIDSLRKEAPELMEAVSQFVTRFEEILREWIQEEERIGNDVGEMGRDEWLDILNKLKESLNNFEINNVENYFQKLLSGADEENSRILRRANSEMQNFQYENAVKILDELL